MRAYIALGSNLGDSQAATARCHREVGAPAELRVLARSRLYRTPPWGNVEQPDFLNAVSRLKRRCSRMILLDALLEIEREAGRNAPWRALGAAHARSRSAARGWQNGQ
jgi:2-amino-4-hydroxy-6-hydroxymethyldihydropteridine diphosphokinase